MKLPSDAAVEAWIRLIRAERGLRTGIEASLKASGFPPLSWYDVLLELERGTDGRRTPGDLERHLLFEQYNLSRLLDRMAAEGLIRRVPFPGDRRRQFIEICDAGRALRQRMWPVYGGAIEASLGAKLDEAEARRLAELLRRLSPG
ncbi:MAG: helix-turn-helix domain-containing protein [Microvirga sp.]